ncbi:MAG: hypothetical protein CBARDMAM_4547 [uncultured Caballeronia sp.]|nr:MAG: hypothetical protein CBARDMAM_4547 [uncultured Caballeronia sp.]
MSSSSPILRLVRLLTLFMFIWAASSVSADPLRIERAKQSLQDYSTSSHDEYRISQSEPPSPGDGQEPALVLSADEDAYLRSLPPLTLGFDA